MEEWSALVFTPFDEYEGYRNVEIYRIERIKQSPIVHMLLKYAKFI